MRGVLPESIRTRTTKTVFSAVWDQEIARQWRDFEAAFGPSAHPEIAQRGYVDQGKFWSRLQRLRDEGSGNDLVYVMGMAELETWLQSLKQPRAQMVTMLPSPGDNNASLGQGREVEVLGARA
jgi:asparagine synthase (glutamine-hydrolysing)